MNKSLIQDIKIEISQNIPNGMSDEVFQTIVCISAYDDNTKLIKDITKTGLSNEKFFTTLYNTMLDKEDEDFDTTFLKFLKDMLSEAEEYGKIKDGVWENGNYMVFKDDQTAEDYAYDIVKIDLEDDPSLFSPDFLQEQVYVSDTDKRVFSNDESDYKIQEMDDDEIIKEAGLQDEYDAAEEDDDSDESDVLQEAKDILIDKYHDKIYKELEDDPVSYFEDRGYTKEQIFDLDIICIDIEEATDAAVSTDGKDHYIDKYDSSLEVLNNDTLIWAYNFGNLF